MGKWETVRLGDIGGFRTGGTPSRKISDYFNGEHPWITTVALGDTYIGSSYANEFLTDEAIEKSATKVIPANSLLIGIRVGVGKTSINSVPMCTNQDIVSISDIDCSLISIEYLQKYIGTLKGYFDSQKRGATIQGINTGIVKELMIPLPPLDVQQKIADVLDNASALIELRKAQMEKLDMLIKSRFIEMFGDLRTNNMSWDMYPFSYVGTIDTHMTNDFELYADVPHIGIENIEKSTGRILSYTLVKDSNLKSGKYPFDERHLIYSKIRPNLNKVAKPNFKGVCSADAYPILPTENSNRDYLALVLRSDFFLEYILAFSGRTNIPKVNKKQLERFCLPVPPIRLQNEFAAFVERVEVQKELLQQSLKKLELNYKALMQKCFRGDLF